MAEILKLDTNELQGYIALYKEGFADSRPKELFKWQAVKCFQDHWDIEASDFSAMLKSSLEKTGNLLSSTQNWPRVMIERFADAEPKTIQAMFRSLFDESQDSNDMETRVKGFQTSAAKLIEDHPKWKMTYQTPNSISTYLWLRFPEKYYIYKYNLAKDVARKLFHSDLPKDKYARMGFAFDLYDAIREEIGKDNDLVLLSQNSLSDDCYGDGSLNTLTIDFCYFVSKNALQKRENVVKMHDKNIILYGPPGTGKTYNLARYAVAIIEEKPLADIMKRNYLDVLASYRKYKDDGLVEFTTFHQSYGYEEFIEGIRPVLIFGENADSGGDIQYEIHDGLFKRFCEKAEVPLADETGPDLGIGRNPTIWKVSLGGTGDNPVRKDCMENNHIRIGWAGYGQNITDALDFTKYGGKSALNAFYSNMQIGDIVLSCYSSTTIDAIGVVTGDVKWNNEPENHYPRVRSVKWIAKGLSENIVDRNGGKTLTLSTVYRLSIPLSDVLDIVKKANPAVLGGERKVCNRVFIIDEINRGNISKIFGELITLIEPSKRIGAAEEMRVRLPYSAEIPFGVPENVYIVATMNTADRSIALLDSALRRRFSFIEMLPDSGLLNDVVVGEVDIAEALDTINQRITVLLDREHTIGHSYLMPLKSSPTIETLSDIFKNKIFPLLQEYFHDDYEKIRLVLGDDQKSDDRDCFVVEKKDVGKLFSNADIDVSEYYTVNTPAFDRIEAYEYLS